jgi:hypothetical protein
MMKRHSSLTAFEVTSVLGEVRTFHTVWANVAQEAIRSVRALSI